MLASKRAVLFGRVVRPSFELPLLTTLVPFSAKGSGTPTFTRATTAYVSDFEGLLKLVLSGEARFVGARRVRNLLVTNSETYAGTGSVTLTTGQTDPVGGITATKVVCAAAGISHRATSNISSAITGPPAVISVWMKGDVGGESIKISDGFIAGTTVVLTTAWTRYSVAVTSSGSVGLYLFAASGTPTFYAARNMAEDVTGQSNTNPSEYVSVGVLAAPYHGAGVDGVCYKATLNGNSVASNTVTEAAGASISAATTLGYCAEGARTNLCLWSNDLTNAAWTAVDITPVKTATGPDGVTNSASTITATAGNGTILQSITSGSAQRVTGCYIKRRTGTGVINMTQDNGGTWTAVTVTAGWTQVSVPAATAANPILGFRVVTSGDAVDVWCVNHELGGFVTSSIPTTTAATTRNVDSLTYPSAGNINNARGTIYVEYVVPGTANPYGGNGRLVSSSGAANDGVYAGSNNASFRDGTTVVNSPTFSVQAVQKLAAIYSGSVEQMYANGVAGTAGVFDGDIAFTDLTIGWSNAGNVTWVPVRNIRIYPAALSAAKLQAMTL